MHFILGLIVGAIAGAVSSYLFLRANPQKAAVVASAVTAVTAADKAVSPVVSDIKKAL
jgi:uncharacterized membrane protein YccC